jgi:hypothetical protein
VRTDVFVRDSSCGSSERGARIALASVVVTDGRGQVTVVSALNVRSV